MLRGVAVGVVRDVLGGVVVGVLGGVCKIQPVYNHLLPYNNLVHSLLC